MDTQPSTFYHPPAIKLINDNLRGLLAMGLPEADLSEGSLLAAARQETGLERFGDESFLPALRRLLTAMETEKRLNPLGRMTARAGLILSLKNRLWANACFEAHPEIRERPVPAPIVIMGLARSGTTRLHRMLATDTRLQHLKAWEGSNPAPRLNQPFDGRHQRYDEVKHTLLMGRQVNPGIDAAHPVEVDEAEEEILLLGHSFVGFGASAFALEPDYYNWLLDADKTSAYRYMRELMQLISWARGDAAVGRWVLKTPQHMMDLPTLMKVFPDARLVFTHRDPLKTVVSMISLAWHFAVITTDLPCRAAVRDMWLDVCEQKARRCVVARESVAATQQMDVYYHEMNADWRAVMRRIYDFIDMEFTPEAESAMQTWLTKSETENRHGAHRYSYADFGLTREEVEARMGFFRERYNIPFE